MLNLSDLNIPEYIPTIPVKVGGLVFSVIILTVTSFTLKEILANNKQVSIVKLILINLLLYTPNEAILQVLRAKSFGGNEIYYFCTGLIYNIILVGIISFFTAYQLKTRRTGRLVTFIIIFVILFNIVEHLFPALFNDK